MRCPGCGAKVRIPADLPISKARCPRCRTPLDGRMKSDLPGSIGSYRIRRRLASGGMGQVYEGTNADGSVPVAIKVLLPEAAEDDNLVQRFDREGALGMALEHANVVRVLECGEDGDSRYMVQELVSGSSLSRMVKRRGGLPWHEAVGIARHIAQALVYLDQRGVIHRDLKPANVLVDQDGFAKVADLGLAKCLDDSLIVDMDSDTSYEPEVLTLAGDQLGTPSYMAPEQVEDSSQVDASCDVYGLGATLFYGLTGQVPFPGKSAIAVMERVLGEPPPRVSEHVKATPAALDELVDWCLAKERRDRPADAQVVIDLFDRILEDPDDVSMILLERRNHGFAPPWVWLMLGVIVLVIVGALLVFLGLIPG